jgi:hypothetical protein
MDGWIYSYGQITMIKKEEFAPVLRILGVLARIRIRGVLARIRIRVSVHKNYGFPA